MNQIFEDLICYPAMYVLHSVMGVSVFFSPQYWNARPFNLYPTLCMGAVLLCAFFIWAKRSLHADGRKAIFAILLMPLLYWIVAGFIALPVELAWHGLIERRFLATHDYTIAFHPFCSPILMDFELVGDKWIEQAQGLSYSMPLELKAKPLAHQLHFGWITAIWALLAISVNTISLILAVRWSKRIGVSLTKAWRGTLLKSRPSG